MNAGAETFDAIIVGSGPAGMELAAALADKNQRVLLLERDKFGGVCAHRGCYPKKMMSSRAAMSLALQADNAQLLAGSAGKLDFPALSELVQDHLSGLNAKHQQRFEDRGVTCLEAEAQFVQGGLIEANGKQYRSKHIVVATGLRPRSLECPGGEHAITSADFFSLKKLPERILFIGGGYISLELACIALAAGCQVAIADQENTILQEFDRRLTTRLARSLNRRRVSFLFETEAERIEKSSTADADSYTIHFSDGEVLEADLILNATGRVPNLEALQLDRVDNSFAASDFRPERLRYELPDGNTIYFAGDLAGDPGLAFTPQAHKEADAIASYILTGEYEPLEELSVTSRAVFSYPELALVSRPDRAGFNSSSAELFVADLNLHAYYSLPESGVLVTYEKSSRQILRAEVLAPSASEVVFALAVMMENNVPVTEFQKELACFPTVGSALQSALAQGLKNAGDGG